MPTVKKNLTKSARTQSTAVVRPSKKTSRKAQPPKRAIHLRLTLHPVSIMLQLCVGVLLVFSTISAFGDTITVTAAVQAALPATAATIDQPSDGTHVTDQTLAISGSCPPASYVDLFINSVYADVDTCSGGTYTITTLLQPGPNVVSVQDYNVLNELGPVSTPITVYFDQVVASPVTPIVPPVLLSVSEVDTDTPYVSQDTVETTDEQPTFTGIAPPFTWTTLVFHSKVVTCTTQADALGFWSCTLPEALPPGIHTVSITGITPSGKQISLPTFRIHVVSKAAVPAAPVAPLLLTPPAYTYQAYDVGQQVALKLPIAGGNLPYTITVSWGDGTTSTYQQHTLGTFVASHTYSWLSSDTQSYVIKAQVVDASGATAAVQSTTIIRNPNYHGVISTVAHTSRLDGIANSLHAWLWLLWPSYLIIALMLVSFWLGERRQRDTDTKRITRHYHHRKRHA
jgi:hypothetical protein